MNWYLRRADGSVYGPVDDDTVLQWAREGRIQPNDALSTDQEVWLDPPSIEALGMDWFIPLSDGTPYGPVHALAMSDLVADGSLGLDDTIAHRVTRDTKRVCEVLLPALQHYSASLRDSLLEEEARAEKLEAGLQPRPAAADAAAATEAAEARTAAEQARAEFDAAQKTIASQTAELWKAQETLTTQAAEVQTLRQQLADEQARAGKLAQDLQQRAPADEEARAHERLRNEIKTARQTIAEQENEIARLKQLLDKEQAAARQHEAEFQQRIKELQESELNLLKSLEEAREKTSLAERKSGVAGATDYGSLVQSYNDLSKNYDLLMEQFTSKSTDLAAAFAANDKLKKESEERLARLEETLKREREEADNARQRLTKAEEAHLELVRSYRELNDRYIRYRQKMEAPAAAPGGDGPAADTKPKVRLV